MEVTSLCVGEPDFLPPAAVLDAARQAIDDGDTRYTAVTGTAQLRRAIADDLKRRKGVIYNPDTEIVVSNGAKQCVYQGILALIGKGDRVLIPSPYWPSYPEMVTLVGGIPVFIPTHAKDGFLLTPEALEQALSEEENSNNNATTKLLILCNPSNPTGGVHNKKRLQELAAVLEKHPHVAVLADEIYERLVYKKEGEEEEEGDDDASSSCPSFAQFLWDRTLTVNGFSKAYAMTGMRLGYLAAPAYVVKAVTTIQSQLTSCAGSISQAAGVAALLRVSDEELRHNVKVMREKRDYVLGELDSMPGVTVAVPPQGAFYVLPELAESYFDGDDTELCLQLLKRKKLALVPGSSFGAPGTVRISYATSMEELKVAMSKLREFLQEENV
jgi:aspartate/methionine/tyrosine aminotransferase